MRANILLITTDEERANLPRPPGYTLPARERLAERGIRFDNYYTASAQCSSARSVIYTGRHVPVTRIYDNDNFPYIQPLDPALGTLGTMLGKTGYYCTYKGKWHLSNAYVDAAHPAPTTDALEPYGFHDWNDWGDIDGGAWAGLRVDPVIAGQAAAWLRNRAAAVSAEQPWFMAVNFVNPHDIMSFDYGGRSPVKLPPNLAHATVVRPPANIPLYARQWDFEAPSNWADDLSGAAPAVHEYAAMMGTVFGRVPDQDHWRAGLNFYLNCLRDVDRNIDVVLDALEASGQADRTVVIMTADHGEMAGSHGLRQKGNLAYDENTHVPMVIAHPDLGGGSTTPALASAVDIAPTVLAVAGLGDDDIANGHPGLGGHSLLPALSGTSVRHGALVAIESVTTLDASFWGQFSDPDVAQRIASGDLRPDWRKRGFLRAYSDERYTFARYFSPLEPNRPVNAAALFAANDVVLYDRASDPGEMTNLSSGPDYGSVVNEYNRKLEELITAEIGEDMHSWVAEKPQLLGWPTWRGDSAA
ncbi:MAG TPA: sulfatase-like hydrolase/transferase [Acidimicrobiales bacterium]|nr:sulfatase-like hydrolase/transferase [Acidimicrobiales bacterium]